MLNLSAQAATLGELPKTVGRAWPYFRQRGCVLDTRGPLVIHATSRWGLGVRVVTRSHDIKTWPALGATIDRGVRVDEGAWIGSYSLLIGCHIGAHAIIAAGTVVRCQDVAPYTMVAGNPARVIARWQAGRWVYLPEEESGFGRVLA